MERDDITTERHVADALRRLNAAAVVPPADPASEAALMAAFDAAHAKPRIRRDYWHLTAFAAAATVLIAVGIAPVLTGRHGPPSDGTATHRPAPAPRDVRLEPPSEFVIVPGAAALPAMESGTLVRMSVPASWLPSLGVSPAAGRGAVMVTADFVVAQDGLPRAVRLVN
jgi:hypothetical protein